VGVNLPAAISSRRKLRSSSSRAWDQLNGGTCKCDTYRRHWWAHEQVLIKGWMILNILGLQYSDVKTQNQCLGIMFKLIVLDIYPEVKQTHSKVNKHQQLLIGTPSVECGRGRKVSSYCFGILNHPNDYIYIVFIYISYIIRGPSSKLRMTIPSPTVHIIIIYIYIH
jgi:hypothetical protein